MLEHWLGLPSRWSPSPALLNAHLGLAWHGVAEAALGALVLINLLEVAGATVARRRP